MPAPSRDTPWDERDSRPPRRKMEPRDEFNLHGRSTSRPAPPGTRPNLVFDRPPRSAPLAVPAEYQNTSYPAAVSRLRSASGNESTIPFSGQYIRTSQSTTDIEATFQRYRDRSGSSVTLPNDGIRRPSNASSGGPKTPFGSPYGESTSSLLTLRTKVSQMSQSTSFLDRQLALHDLDTNRNQRDDELSLSELLVTQQPDGTPFVPQLPRPETGHYPSELTFEDEDANAKETSFGEDMVSCTEKGRNYNSNTKRKVPPPLQLSSSSSPHAPSQLDSPRTIKKKSSFTQVAKTIRRRLSESFISPFSPKTPTTSIPAEPSSTTMSISEQDELFRWLREANEPFPNDDSPAACAELRERCRRYSKVLHDLRISHDFLRRTVESESGFLRDCGELLDDRNREIIDLGHQLTQQKIALDQDMKNMRQQQASQEYKDKRIRDLMNMNAMLERQVEAVSSQLESLRINYQTLELEFKGRHLQALTMIVQPSLRRGKISFATVTDEAARLAPIIMEQVVNDRRIRTANMEKEIRESVLRQIAEENAQSVVDQAAAAPTQDTACKLGGVHYKGASLTHEEGLLIIADIDAHPLNINLQSQVYAQIEALRARAKGCLKTDEVWKALRKHEHIFHLRNSLLCTPKEELVWKCCTVKYKVQGEHVEVPLGWLKMMVLTIDRRLEKAMLACDLKISPIPPSGDSFGSAGEAPAPPPK